MTLEILIPCLDKTREEILSLANFINLQSDAVFLNQCGRDDTYVLDYSSYRLRVICVSWRGVSKARNELIKACTSDIGLLIDDDCVLADSYSDAIAEAYREYPDADAIRFNTSREYWNPVNASASVSRRAKFRDLSSFGMWGFSFRPTSLVKSGVLFDEHLGAPNYLYNGEDSVFLFEACKRLQSIYLYPFFVCEVRETRESTWFESYGERYFVTKGFVYSHLYGWKWRLALLRMFLKYRKEYQMGYKAIRRYAEKGHRMHKMGMYE